MADNTTKTGKLIVKKRKGNISLMIENFSVKAIEQSEDIRRLRIDGKEDVLNGMEVEFESPDGQPVRVRPKGKQWLQPASHQKSTMKPKQTSGKKANTNRKLVGPKFYNPYNFVPAVSRKAAQKQLAKEIAQRTGSLGDEKPVGHQKLFADRFTGTIKVRMSTRTPLLILDAATATKQTINIDGNNVYHPIYSIRKIKRNGTEYPCVPQTEIKGMLRSAYEAITNSRFGIFPFQENSGHDAPQAMRQKPNVALGLVPVRLRQTDDANGSKKYIADLYLGTAGLGQDGVPQQNSGLCAAWLQRYEKRRGPRPAHFATKYATAHPEHGKKLPQHLDHVDCWLEKMQKTGKRGYSYWRVREIVPHGEALSQQQPAWSQTRGKHQSAKSAMQVFDAYVYVSNKNIDGKHDERVFFNQPGEETKTAAIDPSKILRYQQLLENYIDIHKDELKNGSQRPPALTRSEWSRNIKNRERKVQDGTLCYAKLKMDEKGKPVVEELFPVMISRKLFPMSPASLLCESLKPAKSMAELSPADRVFGWASQYTGTTGAYKGQLRITTVKSRQTYDNCVSREFIPPLPLQILGAPKPQQSRFYLAEDESGTCLNSNDLNYKKGRALRGRKVYLHHALANQAYWDAGNDDVTQVVGKQRQEYRRPRQHVEISIRNGRNKKIPKVENKAFAQQDGGDKDDQNRSIKNWINIGSEFEFSIHVTNLSKVELGALLWLLNLPEDCFLRLGGGKPLGFGSVRMFADLAEVQVASGNDWKEYFGGQNLQCLSENELQDCVANYREQFASCYSEDKFENANSIVAFLNASRGFTDYPVHTPRLHDVRTATPPAPHPEGKSFRWFSENNRSEKGQSLPNGFDPSPALVAYEDPRNPK